MTTQTTLEENLIFANLNTGAIGALTGKPMKIKVDPGKYIDKVRGPTSFKEKYYELYSNYNDLKNNSVPTTELLAIIKKIAKKKGIPLKRGFSSDRESFVAEFATFLWKLCG